MINKKKKKIHTVKFWSVLVLVFLVTALLTCSILDVTGRTIWDDLLRQFIIITSKKNRIKIDWKKLDKVEFFLKKLDRVDFFFKKLDQTEFFFCWNENLISLYIQIYWVFTDWVTNVYLPYIGYVVYVMIIMIKITKPI